MGHERPCRLRRESINVWHNSGLSKGSAFSSRDYLISPGISKQEYPPPEVDRSIA